MTDSGEGLLSHPVVRGMLVFSAFRAVYGVGILVVTYALATSSSTPWWTSLIFLGVSMVFSRWLFRLLKRRWPAVFQTKQSVPKPEEAHTTP